jgi:hypothetical protein
VAFVQNLAGWYRISRSNFPSLHIVGRDATEAGALPVERSGTFFTKVGFDLIDAADEQQEAVMGTGRESHFLYGMFQVAGGFGVDLTVQFHLAWVHRGIRGVRGLAEARLLDAACFDHPPADEFGFLAAGGVMRKFAEIIQRHLAVDVDPI